MVEETERAYKIVENPLLRADAIELAKEDIDEKTLSPKSIMPEGLLDRLTEHEVLDLVAFVLARGRREHELFRPTTAH